MLLLNRLNECALVGDAVENLSGEKPSEHFEMKDSVVSAADKLDTGSSLEL